MRITHLPTGIVTSCQDERSQFQNKRKCLRQLRNKIHTLNYQPPKRIQSIKPRTAKEKNLADKKRQARKKKLRKKPEIDD